MTYFGNIIADNVDFDNSCEGEDMVNETTVVDDRNKLALCMMVKKKIVIIA